MEWFGQTEMSEFKFACPVCGQHITADSSASGSHLECPTCFQKIVVPQAAAGDSKFILSASQVNKPRPIPTNGGAPVAPTDHGSKKSLVAGIALVAFILVVGAVAFVFRDKIFKPKPSPEAETKAKQGEKVAKVAPAKLHPIPTNITWSLDLTNLTFPEGGAVGSIHGNGFVCEKATLQGGNLTLRQGRSGPLELQLSVAFFAQQGEELSGKTIEIPSDREPPLPKVTLRWRDEQQQEARKSIPSGYALRVAFGEVGNGRIPGQIFICLPDESKSFVAGSFDAELRKPNPPKQKQPKTPKK